MTRCLVLQRIDHIRTQAPPLDHKHDAGPRHSGAKPTTQKPIGTDDERTLHDRTNQSKRGVDRVTLDQRQSKAEDRLSGVALEGPNLRNQNLKVF